MVYIIDMDSPLFYWGAAIFGVLVLPLVILDSCEREENYRPHTPIEWSSGATPDDADETEW